MQAGQHCPITHISLGVRKQAQWTVRQPSEHRHSCVILQVDLRLRSFSSTSILSTSLYKYTRKQLTISACQKNDWGRSPQKNQSFCCAWTVRGPWRLVMNSVRDETSLVTERGIARQTESFEGPNWWRVEGAAFEDTGSAAFAIVFDVHGWRIY